jgi:hypothetical protein
MTRFTFNLYGSHLARKKRRSGEPCPYVTGKGLGRGTSFFDKSAGGVTCSRIGASWCGKAELGVGEVVRMQRMRGEGVGNEGRC